MGKTSKVARPRKPAATSNNPVTKYAHDVLALKVIAGPLVRAACERHLRDLVEGPKRGLTFSIAHCDRGIGFFHDVLCLNGGEYEGKPFVLLDWQQFVIGSIFGWIGADGFRRFRIIYIEAGKGSGKSPLIAGLGMEGLVADGEQRAEVYLGAAKRDQAMVMYRDALAMKENSPVLASNLIESRGMGVENLAYHRTHSFFRPIASDDRMSGLRPHFTLLDEVHEHRDANMVNMMRLNMKNRRQGLLAMITNSGHDTNTVAWHYHEYAEKVCNGVIDDDTFFGYVCGLDPDDEPLRDEKCWPKANPSLLAGLPGYAYLRREVNQARGMPSAESEIRRLNFCQWTEAEAPWIGKDVWDAVRGKKEFDPLIQRLKDRRCYAGLDLSSTTDLTSLVLIFEPEEPEGVWDILPFFWIPADGLIERMDRDRVPYREWIDAGFVETTPGSAISKLFVAQRAASICADYEPLAIAYDRWRIEDFRQVAADEGLSLPPLIEHGQGFKDMAPAVDEFERRLALKIVRHNGNPCLRWNVANTVLEADAAGNRKPNKRKAHGRIDGVVAALMATGASMKERKSTGSVYSELARRAAEQKAKENKDAQGGE